jgi:hypothetical protein
MDRKKKMGLEDGRGVIYKLVYIGSGKAKF